jgi:hypothetical protein
MGLLLSVLRSILQGMKTIKKDRDKEEPVSIEALVQVLLEPLSSLIDKARLEVLKGVQELAGDVEWVGRQVQRLSGKADKGDVSA